MPYTVIITEGYFINYQECPAWQIRTFLQEIFEFPMTLNGGSRPFLAICVSNRSTILMTQEWRFEEHNSFNFHTIS